VISPPLIEMETPAFKPFLLSDVVSATVLSATVSLVAVASLVASAVASVAAASDPRR
jgi:hypothetical protein